MTDEQLRAFVSDLVVLLKEKYNDSLPGGRDLPDDAFNRGANFAYYDALDLIHSQLVAFGYDPGEFQAAAPVLGERA